MARREQVVKTAEKYVARGKIEAAIKEYRKVLGEQPNDSNTLNRVGDLYARIEKIDEAIQFFTQIASNYTDDGFFVKAIAIYKKIIKLDPTRLEIYEKLAELYHRQGLINEARSQYQVLADYYSKHENAASVLSIYERMAELEPENPSHRVKLAELYQAQQLTDRAIGEYRSIAELMITHGSLGEAEKVYERALDVDASDLDFIAEAVDRLRSAGDEGAAGRLLAVAARKNPAASSLARRPAPGAAAASSASAAPAAPAPAAPPPAAPPPSQPPPQPVVQPTFEPRPAASEAPVEVAPEASPTAAGAGADLVVDLDLGAFEEPEPPSGPAPAPGPSASVAAATSDGAISETGEFELDLDDVFVLDLEEETPPESLVAPPPDIESTPSFQEQHSGDRTPAGPSSPPAFDSPPPADDAVPFTLGPDPEELAAESVAPAEPLPTASAPPNLDEGVFELVDTDAAEVAEPPPSAPPPQAALPEAGPPPIDADFLERTAAELLPPERQAEDLLTEAEVFAKYGLEEKAADRLQEALKLAPRHLEVMALLVQLYLDKKKHGRVISVANQMARTAAESGDDQAWRKIRRRLEGAGYHLDGDRVTASPSRSGETDRAVGKMLAQLLEGAPEEAAAAPSGPGSQVDERVAELAAEAAARPTAEPPTPPVEEMEAAAPAADLAQDLAAGNLEDSGTEWLSQVEAAASTVSGEAASAELDEEEDFFDLAAEIEQELDAEQLDDDLLAQPREQTLEEIVEGFKQGVSENLSAEDYDTHFNLGIAYREMSLLDEAIGEFQLAAKAPERLVECCSMLGLCFLEKGIPELAIKWYERGLASDQVSEDDHLGLLYDLGNVYLTIGEIDQARSLFVDIYGTNSHYRDIVAKLEEVSARQ